MNKSTLMLAAGMLALNVGTAQEFSLVSSSDELIIVNHELTDVVMSPEMLTFSTIGSDDYRDFSKSHKIVSKEAGAPSLPFFTESVIVPGQGNVSLEVTYTEYTDFEGVLVAPSKGS